MATARRKAPPGCTPASGATLPPSSHPSTSRQSTGAGRGCHTPNSASTGEPSPVFPGRRAHLQRRGEDRQGWQTRNSKFLARSKACGLTTDRQAHRQNSGRCRGNQQQGQRVSGLDDRQMLNGEWGQLGWTLRSRRNGRPFRTVRYAAAFGTSNAPCRKEGAVPHGSRQGARIRSRSAVGSFSGTHRDAPAPRPTAQRPC